jgi:hypothetical protein
MAWPFLLCSKETVLDRSRFDSLWDGETVAAARALPGGLVRGWATPRFRAVACANPLSEPALSFEVVENLLPALIDRFLLSFDVNVWLHRGLIRVIVAGEVLDLAGFRLGPHTLDVALCADLSRGVDEDLDQVGHIGPEVIPDASVGAHDGTDDRRPIARKQVGYEPHAEHVGITVLAFEAEPFGEVGANDVAVENFDVAFCVANSF